ncbi:MAG TPA: molybdopterin cofactor-binding domain-containing protein [Pseudomonadales bacterium]
MTELPAGLKRYPELDRWVRIDPADTVTVFTGKVEIGQGITTALALIASHELGVAPERIRVQTAHTGVTPNELITAGSMSVEQSGAALRQACAHARRHLLEAAAARLGVPASELAIDDGWISAPGLNERVSLWALQGGEPFRRRIEERIPERPPAPPPARQTRIDLPDKLLGRGVFLHDLHWPEMRHARVVRPPTFRHRLEGFAGSEFIDRGLETAPTAAAGVRLIRDGSFIAVIGDDEYQVVRHAERVARACRWRLVSPLEGVPLGRDSQAFLLDGGTPVTGPVPPLGFEPTFSASYSRPHLMHAALAPSAAAACWQGGRLTVWSHSQGVELLKRTLADVLGLEADAVTVIHVQGAGAYGHNGADDAALDAALCALAEPGRPVLLKWTRTQEHRWEPYGPAMRVDLAAALDGAGRITGWSHEVWSYTHAGRPVPGERGSNLAAAWLRAEPREAPPAVPRLEPEVGIHRNAWPIYALPAPRVVKRFVAPGPLRTSSLRSLGAHGNVFAIESFMDELALLAGRDPVTFRLEHLADPRARAVLEAAATLCGGVTGPRGVALARYKNRQTYAAVVVEVEVDPTTAAVRVPKVWIAADAGRVVDPDGLINQLEGGAVQALSWTLKERVRFRSDDIESEDWVSYPVLRFDETPEVITRLLDRPEQPSLGAGEATAGPTAAALANAVFAACGVRVRDMPLDAERLREAAAA